MIDAGPDGPTELQRSTYQRVRELLSALRVPALAFIHQNAYETVEPIKLSLYCVEIGTDEECNRFCFTLEFTDEAAELIHRVTFVNGSPLIYGADD